MLGLSLSKGKRLEIIVHVLVDLILEVDDVAQDVGLLLV